MFQFRQLHPRTRAACVAVAAVFFLAPGLSLTPAHAIQIALTETSVIGGSGSFEQSPYNVPGGTGDFTAGNVFDNQLATTQNDVFAANYWLGKQGDFQEFFVFDLGQSHSIERFDIFNTHNSTFNDRGTANFQFFGSNAITPTVGEGVGAGFDLLNAVSLGTGTLAFQTSGNDPIEA